MKLKRDTQIEANVQRVMVRNKGAGGRATRRRFQNRGLHFQKAVGVQKISDGPHDFGTRNQHVAGVAVDKQVHVPLSVAHFYVGQLAELPVPALVFLAQRHVAQGFGKQHGIFGVDTRLTRFGVEHVARHA